MRFDPSSPGSLVRAKCCAGTLECRFAFVGQPCDTYKTQYPQISPHHVTLLNIYNPRYLSNRISNSWLLNCDLRSHFEGKLSWLVPSVPHCWVVCRWWRPGSRCQLSPHLDGLMGSLGLSRFLICLHFPLLFVANHPRSRWGLRLNIGSSLANS
jgi:hypothetical protein